MPSRSPRRGRRHVCRCIRSRSRSTPRWSWKKLKPWIGPALQVASMALSLYRIRNGL